MASGFRLPVLLAQLVLALSTAYLLVLLAAARMAHRITDTTRSDGGRCHFKIIVPAYNEQSGIQATIDSLQALDYPSEKFEIVVIADNCTDLTADIARSAGATVHERFDDERRGKGYALSWAVDRLLPERPEADAVVVIDADATASPNLLRAMESRLLDGALAVQVNNVVSNPDESWSSALRFAAFSLINTVRPRGKTALGLSAGLHGTGMGFSRLLLERHPWSAHSLAEDNEYHLRIVAAGERVHFVPEASVRSPMPTTLASARSQQLRWEGGRWYLIRKWTPSLLRQGIRDRDAVRVNAAVEPLVPPQAVLFAGNFGLAVIALLLRSRAATRIGFVNLAAHMIYVLGGLWLVRAPRSVYLALALSPILVVWKIGLWVGLVRGKQPANWVRTTR